MAALSKTQGLLFMIVGPPGVGKNALMEEALKSEHRLNQLATATTRPRRPYEQEGRERLFVTIEQFRQMIANGELLEWQEVHRNKFYGVPRQVVENALAEGQNLIADIDVLGATYIRSLYPENTVLIFVKPPSVEALEDRMHVRGESEEDIQTRLSRVAMEMDYLPVADYIVVNDDFEQAARQFQALITSEIERQLENRPVNRRYTHAVSVLPVYDQEVLCRPNPPRYPHTYLQPREIPHIAALRVMEETFAIAPSVNHLLRIKRNAGSFISPVEVTVRTEGTTKHITFTYVYLLPQRLSPPDDWMWQPANEEILTSMDREVEQTWEQLIPNHS